MFYLAMSSLNAPHVSLVERETRFRKQPRHLEVLSETSFRKERRHLRVAICHDG